MPRVQRAAILFLAAGLPLTAIALGLGEIQLKSALNQPLAADIPVTTDSGDELADLRVSLAPPETFQRFGLDRPAYLEGISFQVRREGGSSVIRVTSPEPIGEPFVSLLLDVSWPQGRLLREYTVLLDPPAFADTPSPLPVSVAPAPAPTAPAAAPIRRPVEPAPAQAPRVTTGPDGSSYGPVRANETLWAISEQLRADSGVTLDQMMMALYRANPDAFAGNINLLRRGAILRVPDAAEIASLPGSQAAVEVQRQNEAWRSPAAPAAEPPPARLQLVPPAEAPATPSGPAPGAATSRPPASVATAPAGAEAELAEARRLLALKDSELKSLQDRLAAAEGQPPATTVPEAPPADPDAEVAVERLPTETPQTPELDSGEPAVDAEATTPTTQAAARPERPAKPRKVRESGGSWLSALGALVFNAWFLLAAAVVLLAGLFFVFARRRLAADDGGGRFAGVPGRGDMLGGAAAGAGARARAPEGFVVEEEDVAERTMSTPILGRGAAARGPAVGGDAEAPLERTISTDGAVELDQADVIAEADFHMAYGLYDQAAELLTRALKSSPDRRDLRMKLLEVYFIWENKPAFLREAQAFQSQLKGGADPDWNKVVIMGKQICPGEALFAGAVSGASADVIDFTLADDDKAGDVDVSFDDPRSTGVDLDLTGAQKVAESDLLDFDFGEVAGTDDTSVTPTEVAPGVRTTEVPTIEARYAADVSPTMETPTVESRGLETPTLETPTIETAAAGTMETPTLESSIAGLRAGTPGEGGDHTEELNVEDLGLDLTGLDQAAGDLGTGIHGALGADDQAGADQDDVFDIGTAEEDEESDLLQGLESDSTAEMRGMAVDEGTLDLPAFGTAMEKSARGRNGGVTDRGIDDTAEQPRVSGLPGGELGDQSGELSQVDFDIGGDTDAEEDLEATSVAAAQTGTRRRPEGPTMTEVGTKLDLARAYVDMGDPEGARSILNEVLEEGDTAQRQEARKLLDDLAG